MSELKIIIDVKLELLGPLSILLKRGEVAYKNYISNGRTLLYAKVIKINNEQIREVILKKAHLLPFEYQSYAIDLVEHIDIWHVMWEDLFMSKKFNLDDMFIFENKATFPKESVASLFALYSELNDPAL